MSAKTGKSDLTEALVKAMEVLHSRPEYQQIYDKWGMSGYALPAAELGRLKAQYSSDTSRS
ncbi:hypothetical protein SAMN05216275_102214 [Streptosporangium canum]|uniref:Uncharacterized protein n=2 Tax=Streptosporangium canum TaxID=324952 RepID=A0A1I3GTE2_9ACTN|nr:hypothetical protein [Streptosporangium canum]SFI26778.1 hypothetical protein SAMN05216275_102214 [Streptosporangium canum]